MSKLVDKERLARLAKALDDRAKAAVAALKQEVDAKQQLQDNAIQANLDAINAINHAETGILAQAKAHAVEQDNKVREDFAAEDDLIKGRLEVLEGIIEGDEGLTFKEIIERIEDVEGEVDVLNGDENVEGSVKKAVADGVNPIDQRLTALEAEVGDPAAEGVEATGMYKVMADADAVALQAAKDYADQEIAALVDSAPEALNTLRELAEAIDANKDVYDAYVEQHAEAMAALKAELQKEIDDDVKVETDRAVAKEGELAQAIVDAEAAAKQHAENKIAEHVQAADAKNKEQDDAIKANKDALDVLNGGEDVEGSVAKSIADALEPFSNTDEVKAMLGNVVNSLALSMENNKMMLKLGGVDGITIHETSLDMATDDDIDAIIAGLDAVAGE